MKVTLTLTSAAHAEVTRRQDRKQADIKIQEDDFRAQSKALGSKKVLKKKVAGLLNRLAKLQRQADRGADFHDWAVDLEETLELSIQEHQVAKAEIARLVGLLETHVNSPSPLIIGVCPASC